MRDKRRFPGLMAVFALVLASCTAGAAPGPEYRTIPGSDHPPRGILAGNALVPFDACDTFLDYMIRHGVDLVGPYGFGGGFFHPLARAMTEDGAAAEAAAGGADFSGTNVQVEGVDEPDIVKTDGDRIVLLADSALFVADVTGEQPVVTGRLRLDGYSVQSLFLAGDTVLLFGSAWDAIPLADTARDIATVSGAPTIQILEVDIASEPEIVRTMSIDGQFLSARMVGSSARVVMTSAPVGFDWEYPTGSGLRSEREAIEANREIVRNSKPENWIPYYIVADGRGRVSDEGTLFDCSRASRPGEFSGLDMLSVVTIDISRGLEVVDATGVVATGNTVYASAESLYVATQSWQTWIWGRSPVPEEGDRPEQVVTEIHKFDISGGDRTDYLASGEVTGYLLNQFSMDEKDGLLRVASTTAPAWWGGGFESESLVTVLAEDDGRLTEVGLVDGLGKTEQIHSVRFLGDVAYVVTFRQTDPLYTVDLSDPANPRVLGELKILGYSAYLHPVGQGLILGVGQDATETGQIQGTQISLFDVSDLAAPTRLDQLTLSKGSSSDVEYDHHAFLYWPETGLAVVPVHQWWWEERVEKESVFFGAVALRVDPSGDLAEIARLVHPGGDGEGDWDWRARIMRSIVIGDSLYTVSAKGIMVSDLETLDLESWVEF